MLRNSLAGGLFGTALMVAGSAFAADMPAPAPDFQPAPPAPPAPVFFDWTGPYAGLHVGHAWGTYSGNSLAPAPAFGYSTAGDGWLAGGQIGYNMQFDQFVVGVEGDLSWAGMDGGVVIPGLTTLSMDNKWFGTIRARAGVAIDNVLLYGTGGAAFTRINMSGTGFGSDANTHAGWTIGAGVEAALTEMVSLKGEYLYADFNNKTYNLGALPVRQDYDAHVVRAGVNFRFGGF